MENRINEGGYFFDFLEIKKDLCLEEGNYVICFSQGTGKAKRYIFFKRGKFDLKANLKSFAERKLWFGLCIFDEGELMQLNQSTPLQQSYYKLPFLITNIPNPPL